MKHESFPTKPRIQYVIESESEQTSAENAGTCLKRSSSKRRSAKFKNVRTPPIKKKLESDTSDVAASTSTTDTIATTELDTVEKIKRHEKAKLTSHVEGRKTKLGKVQCLKFLVFGCVLVSLLVNFGLLALGTFLKADPSFSQFLSENYRQATETQFTAPSLYKGTYAMIILSFLAIIINFAGCCGVIRNSVCMLGTFFGVLIVLFLFQMSVGLLWLFRREAIENEVAVSLDYMVQHYYQGPGIVQEVLDSIQTIFRCCGNAGCGDFVFLRLTVPRTCDLDCYGCRDRMFRILRDGFTVIYVFGIAMLLAEIIAILSIMYLICRLKDQPKDHAVIYKIQVVDEPPSFTNSSRGRSRRNVKNQYAIRAEPSLNNVEAKIYKSKDAFPSSDKITYLAYPVDKFVRQKGSA